MLVNSRVTVVLLGVLVLVQPVSAFASVRALPAAPDQTPAATEDAAEASDRPCHEAAGAAEAPRGRCCGSMQNPACLLDCAMLACAISTSSAKAAVVAPAVIKPGAFQSYRFQSPSRIFHPPRTG